MTHAEAGSSALERAKQFVEDRGGVVRASEVIAAGIHPRTLYKLRDNGDFEQVARGVYRLSDGPELANPDLVAVAVRAPKAVVCLTSALAFHDITTQTPHVVSIALPRGSRTPRLDFPPIDAHRFSESAFSEGVESHCIDGVRVAVYCAEKTLADCCKFRNKLGIDILLEALRLYRTRREVQLDKILHFARVCRVEKVICPYLEAIF